MNERKDVEIRKKQFKKLLRGILRNPQKGIEKFYDTYKKIIQATAKMLCRSPHKANEVVNDVLIKVWQYAEVVLTTDVKNPEGWVYVITVNTAKTALRERYNYTLEENRTAEVDLIQQIYDRSSFDWLIKDLSETEQTIMIQRFIAQYTFQEIADELEKPLPTVTSIYYRGLEKIKKRIERKNKN